MKSMLQSKQSDQFDTLRLTRSSCGQWFSSIACKKAKANENIDCFSLIKGQWKLFKGQWKVKEFLLNFNSEDLLSKIANFTAMKVKNLAQFAP